MALRKLLLVLAVIRASACDCDCTCCDRDPTDTRSCCGGNTCSSCCFQRGIPLATFDGRANHTWGVENDPVMGGKSSSTWKLVTTANGTTVGHWAGSCRIVPSLKAPGFVFALTKDVLFAKFPSVASEDGLLITMRNLAGNVTLYQVAFCDSKLIPYKCQFGTFKANFTLPPAPMSDMTTVFVPWSAFSDKWSAATGKHTAEDPPSLKSLSHISQLQLWVEGVQGDFTVELEGIRAGKRLHTIDVSGAVQ